MWGVYKLTMQTLQTTQRLQRSSKCFIVSYVWRVGSVKKEYEIRAGWNECAVTSQDWRVVSKLQIQSHQRIRSIFHSLYGRARSCIRVPKGPVSSRATDKATVVYGREDKLTTVTKGSETTRRWRWWFRIKRKNYCGPKRTAAHLRFICMLLIFLGNEKKDSKLVQQVTSINDTLGLCHFFYQPLYENTGGEKVQATNWWTKSVFFFFSWASYLI